MKVHLYWWKCWGRRTTIPTCSIVITVGIYHRDTREHTVECKSRVPMISHPLCNSLPMLANSDHFLWISSAFNALPWTPTNISKRVLSASNHNRSNFGAIVGARVWTWTQNVDRDYHYVWSFTNIWSAIVQLRYRCCFLLQTVMDTYLWQLPSTELVYRTW